MANAVHLGFDDSPKICRLVDPVPLTLDHLNPESIDFVTVSRNTSVPSFKSFQSKVFFLSCKHHTHPHSHTHIHHDKAIVITVLPYCIVGTDYDDNDITLLSFHAHGFVLVG